LTSVSSLAHDAELKPVISYTEKEYNALWEASTVRGTRVVHRAVLQLVFLHSLLQLPVSLLLAEVLPPAPVVYHSRISQFIAEEARPVR
jgi:hypothetical protein